MTFILYHRRVAQAVIGAVILATIPACTALGGAAAGPPSPTTTPTSTLTQATLQTDPSRLPSDITRAIERAHWGLLHLAEYDGRLEARALLPDGRTARIAAQHVDGQTITATVVVGHFGDTKAERAFLTVLEQSIADKPRPVRNASFELVE